MKEVKLKAHLKRNVIIAAVVVFVCAAAYLNWSYNQKWGGTNTAMAEAEDDMTDAVKTMAEMGLEEDTSLISQPVSDYFAEARMTRQLSRDQALSLLETAASSENASREVIDSAMSDITVMANWSLMESKIENELLAKSFADCVVYMSDEVCTVALPAPLEGLSEEEVARVTEIILTNTEYSAGQINVIEVMNYE